MSHSAEAHHPGLAHHFESYEQQKQSSLLGMWAFLAQEVMFFGGLFVVYVAYRSLYGHDFILASRELSPLIGFANTCVLLLSSFTMVLAVWAAQHGRRNLIVVGLILTILLGGTFLGVKWFTEYQPKWEHHLVPGPHFEWHGAEGGPAVEIFFSLYFVMTGMHALHMVVGIGIMLFMIPLARKGKWTPENHNFIEGFGLYWHFVDIVWIFLFPFLYLIGLST